MALAIGPVGDVAHRRRLLMIHGGGLVAGSVLLAAILTIVGVPFRLGFGALPATAQLVVCIAGSLVLVLWAMRVLTGSGLPFPRSSWQVPSAWRFDMPYEFTLGLYGFLLGLGILTDIVMPTFWLLIAASLAVAHPLLIVLIWIGYALVRLANTWRVSTELSCSPDPGYEPAAPSGMSRFRIVAAIQLVAVGAALLLTV